MENLSKLKELEYLNLALNNIHVIEGIEQCESLQKLDLTLNFINGKTIKQSIACLQNCRIKELYLTGNPITDWKNGYRDYVIGQVDSLQVLDGKDINHTERIKAKQRIPQLEEELLYFIEEEEIKKEQQQNINQDDGKQSYTPEVRKQMQLQSAKEKEEKDRRMNPDKYVEKIVTPTHTNDGKIRQCDEGGYRPYINQWDDPEYIIFKMNIPKFLDTQLIDININPTYISVRIKGKLTQLRLDEEVYVEKSIVQRSEITGELVVKMLKVKPNEQLKALIEGKKKQEMKQQSEEIKKKQEQDRKEKERISQLIQIAQAKQTKQLDVNVDDDDIPDLE